MRTEQVITGKEPTKDKDSPIPALIGAPIRALVAFYKAFNQGDLELMADNWLQDDEAVMSNPLGGIKRGWNEISQVYERIFNGPAHVYVEFYDFSIRQSNDMFCAVGRERGFLRVADKEIALVIRTSRIYKKQNGQWKQCHHHGSMDDPRLLAEYQTAVL